MCAACQAGPVPENAVHPLPSGMEASASECLDSMGYNRECTAEETSTWKAYNRIKYAQFNSFGTKWCGCYTDKAMFTTNDICKYQDITGGPVENGCAIGGPEIALTGKSTLDDCVEGCKSIHQDRPLCCDPSGLVQAQQGLGCISCNAGWFSNEGDAQCTQCPPGYYSSSAGASECTQCPAGSYTNTGTKPGATTCTQADVGHYANGQTMKPCAPGSYSSTKGAASCPTCPENSDDKCACNAGYFPYEHECKPCTAGFYCPKGTSYGTRESHLCPTGQYSHAGAAECLSCPEGYYCPKKQAITFDGNTAGLTPHGCPPCQKQQHHRSGGPGGGGLGPGGVGPPPGGGRGWVLTGGGLGPGGLGPGG